MQGDSSSLEARTGSTEVNESSDFRKSQQAMWCMFTCTVLRARSYTRPLPILASAGQSELFYLNLHSLEGRRGLSHVIL